jgi:hypothetical protein
MIVDRKKALVLDVPIVGHCRPGAVLLNVGHSPRSATLCAQRVGKAVVRRSLDGSLRADMALLPHHPSTSRVLESLRSGSKIVLTPDAAGASLQIRQPLHRPMRRPVQRRAANVLESAINGPTPAPARIDWSDAKVRADLLSR